ncbi:MAG: NAD(P)/FAD-dependent oxidoreductase [Desulfobulbaceae bacterium]|nr:NAD(P)/FAD-dependent oxidoreductase [Desulfobulbaceae bacterium]
MENYDQVIIGGGLSGLAAGIRLARFGSKVLILEKHAIPGGLNSYYYRQGRLLETGLHALTNYAAPGVKHAPLNRLFRQLSLSRKQFQFCQQLRSTILFRDHTSLSFSNDPALLDAEVSRVFPGCTVRFRELVELVRHHDPFQPRPWSSARARLKEILGDELLINMLLWPVMIYGNSNEHDMDFDQFVIMFSALYLEGMFRPAGSIKEFLDQLVHHFQELGGELRLRAPVARFEVAAARVSRVVLESGEEIGAGQVISTAGYPATLGFMGNADPLEVASHHGRMSFVEIINVLPTEARAALRHADNTIIFYNFDEPFDYRCPEEAVNLNCGVICFPDNFHDLPARAEMQLRVTHPANYQIWQSYSPEEYRRQKCSWAERSGAKVAEIVGNFRPKVLYQDVFTPLTVERFTSKAAGAIYGSPIKVRDGCTPLRNLFVAGTDQGYLGIVGAMLSGVTMVNQHIFSEK